MLQRPRSPRRNLCGAPVHTRGTKLTISFPELAQAQGLSLSQRNFDAVRQFYEPPNKPSVALDNILRSHRQTPWKLKRAVHLTSPSPRLARGNYRAHVCSEFVRIKVILAIKTVKSNRHLDVVALLCRLTAHRIHRSAKDQKADSCRTKNGSLFDHRIGRSEQRRKESWRS